MFETHAYFRNTSIPNILSWKNSAHHHVWVDESEGVNDNFALHRLDGIYHNSNSPEIRLKMTKFKQRSWYSGQTLTCLKEPQSSAGCWCQLLTASSRSQGESGTWKCQMEDLPISAVTSHFNLPANNHFWPTSLFQHVQHFCLRTAISRYEQLESLNYRYYNINLENGINCFNGNSGSRLGHGEHIDHPHWERLSSRTKPEFSKGYNWQISTSPVYSSTNSPSMRPMTSMGTPARPCFNILSRAREEM